MTYVINFFGGPGSGKSTSATGLFSLLKMNGISAEYVSEYAKDIVWEETQKLLDNQLHIFAEQFRRQWRLRDKVEYIITDSPLIIGKFYFDFYNEKIKEETGRYPHKRKYIDCLHEMMKAGFEEFENINIFVERNKKYNPNGRIQTEDEAKEIDSIMRNHNINYNLITNSKNSIEDTFNYLSEFYVNEEG